MSDYRYDRLLAQHFEKNAGFGSVMWQGAKGLGRGAMHMGRGALGFDAKAGAGLGGRLLTGAGAIGGAVAPVAAGALQMSKTTTASLREMAHVHNMQKHAEHGALHKALHVAPYLGWAGSHLLEDTAIGKKHPWLPKAISTASYLGLAGNAAHDAYTNPQERITGAVDAAALMAMLGADVARWRRPTAPGP